MPQAFNNPPATPSSVGPQISNEFYQKKALIEAAKEQYFGQLADVTAMPKNMGKKIKRYHYLPLLDDANINDQGIDAAGVAIANGNLYGSSKDIGTISGKLPVLSETGGRVNRVGFKRKEIEGTLEKFGFFDEYTQESLDFDTDAELMQHINREMVMGANEITEDSLQIDLINAAGVVKYAGNATDTVNVGADDLVSYSDLMHLAIDLDNNRTPKHTTAITGTRMVDTKTIPACRVAYIGSELLPTFKAMKDLHNLPAFIPVEKYAAGGTTLTGEVGSVDNFRLVVVPEMLKWAGAGADASADSTNYETANRFDVFPILVVGNESFTTIGFQTDGKTVKFKITHKAPGEATADRNDPYGETGFMSIKWYYGFMALRPERIALIKTVARL
ncbi:MAG: N4 gp56-like protein [uncultured bacterium]|nr:MAG: N4 gp56-like protein [uncultured bacterium]